ncbi:MAG: hypothetical protein NC131_15015 [Roseburia sp.]|nr:hypothetical protein [Roseburia sp.]
MRLSMQYYLENKKYFKTVLGCTENEFTELLRMDYEDSVKIVSDRIVELINNKQKLGFNLVDIISMWDLCWFFKRNLHVIVPEPLGYVIPDSGIDTSCLGKLEKDIEIDTEINGEQMYIRLVHRNFPVVFRGTECFWTIDAYKGDETKLHFSFEGGKNVRKVYIDSKEICSNCKQCELIPDKNEIGHYRRPRFRQECPYEKVAFGPMFLLSICMQVASVYVNRNKIVKSRTDSESRKMARTIMVATADGPANTERTMSLYEYVKEYHESGKRKEWQGGHHKSPVAHPRSGYYRKSSVGTHIIEDGEFKFVGKGNGNFTYVAPQVINAHRDEVVMEVL